MAFINKEELLKQAQEKRNGVFAAPVIVNLIEKAPEVDVYKLGEWKIVNNWDFEQVDAECSICGYTDVFDETGFYKYCPECGAKMKGGAKDEKI